MKLSCFLALFRTFLLMSGGFLVPTNSLIIHALVTGVPEIPQSVQFSFLESLILIRLCYNITASNQEKSQPVSIETKQYCTLLSVATYSM